MNTDIIKNSTPENIKKAAEIIKQGGLVAFPTETVYGLGANALDATASSKIYSAKGRPSDNPLIVHIAYPAEAEKYCFTSPLFYKLAERFMPGPLTVIMPKKSIIPDTTTGGLDTVAIRVPSNAVAHMLIEMSGVPVAAPSANISGKPSPTTFEHIVNDLNGKVDLMIDGGACSIGLESTVVKIEDDMVMILRPGAITPEMLSDVCRTEIGFSVTKEFQGKAESPGMKYRHYAPDAKLILLDGDDKAVYEYLADKNGCGILCFNEDIEHINPNNKILTLGAKNDIDGQAHKLFMCLRSFFDVDIIYARAPVKRGIGLAVFNRLIKASGYTYIELD